MIKKITLFFIILSIIGTNLLFVKAQESAKVFINETEIQFDTQPIVINDRVMVPFRKIFEALGASEIDWDEKDQSIFAVACYNRITLQIDNKIAVSYGQEVQLDVPPMVINDRTLVPLRFVTQSVGAKVEWNAETQTVHITIPTSSGIEQERVKYYEKYPEVISLESTGCNSFDSLDESGNGEPTYQYYFGDYETLTSEDMKNICMTLYKYELLLKENGYRSIDAITTTRWFTNEKYYIGIFYFNISRPMIYITQDGSSFNQ